MAKGGGVFGKGGSRVTNPEVGFKHIREDIIVLFRSYAPGKTIINCTWIFFNDFAKISSFITR